MWRSCTGRVSPPATAASGARSRCNELARALSHERHVVTLALPRAAGTTGAQDALAWQTGYAGNVDLASGHPELVTATQPLQDADDVDVALRIDGAPARLAAGVAEIALCSLPADRAGSAPAVSIRTAAAGVEAARHRPPARRRAAGVAGAAAGGAPTAAALLTRLLAEVRR